MKIKTKPIRKYYDGEMYIFTGGKAVVPSMRIYKKPVTITLAEFKELEVLPIRKLEV